MDQSDEDLAAACQAGDESAFEQLVTRHLKVVYSFATRNARQNADDIVQETFLKAWQHIRRYSSERAAFKTWLMHITRTTTIDFLRRKRSIPMSEFETVEGDNVLEDSLTDNEPLADELFVRSEDAETLEMALQQLPLLQREVIVLRYGSGLIFEEIAQIVEASANTIKTRHRRGIVALRKIMNRK